VIVAETLIGILKVKHKRDYDWDVVTMLEKSLLC